MTRAELTELIDRNKTKLADLKATGTQRMSKQGVKWCCEVTRDTLKRLRQQLRESRTV